MGESTNLDDGRIMLTKITKILKMLFEKNVRSRILVSIVFTLLPTKFANNEGIIFFN